MLKSVIGFGDHYRHKFIAQVARSIPPGLKVLDAGAGPKGPRVYGRLPRTGTQDLNED